MSTELADHGDTAVLNDVAPGLAWLPRGMRKHFTPAAAWSVVCVIVGAGVATAKLYQQATDLRHDVVELKREAMTFETINARLTKIDTNLAVMDTKLTDLTRDVSEQQVRWNRVETELSEQQSRWSRVEMQASLPPRGRR